MVQDIDVYLWAIGDLAAVQLGVSIIVGGTLVGLIPTRGVAIGISGFVLVLIDFLQDGGLAV